MYSKEKLNDFLNEICNYLDEEHSFFLNNLYRISLFNDSFLNNMKNYSFSNHTIENHLTFEDVVFLAREIIEKIDSNYLKYYNQMISNGELNFDYEKEDTESRCVITYFGEEVMQKNIHISRVFNYNDVCVLVHEFIHYTNGDANTQIKDTFAEFLSIYFELYTNLYLLKKGIPWNELDSLERLKIFEKDCALLNQYEIVLLAYVNFGPIDEETPSLLQKYFYDISKENFEKECFSFYTRLSKLEKKYFWELKNNPKDRGRLLCEDFLTRNYQYVLGTALAFYALKYAKFDDVVFLNHHIHDYEGQKISSVCNSIGIDILNKNFLSKVLTSIHDYTTYVETFEKNDSKIKVQKVLK